MHPDELKKIQLARLKAQLRYVYERSPFYRRKFNEAGVKPEDLKTLEDLKKFPFTTKMDLRQYAYPHGGDLICVPLSECPYFHCTSGTTGKPTIMYYTRNDQEKWANVMARALYGTGCRKGDIMLNNYGYGLFTGGLGFHYGATRIGVTVIPWSIGRTEALIEALRDFKVTVLTGTPSYDYYIGELILKMGISPEKDLNLRICIPGAETWTEEMRRRIEEWLGLKAHGGGARMMYGLTEMFGPGVATECEYENGMHVWADYFYPEIIDPDTGEPVSPGEQGELVLTNLVAEAIPLIRYRTRDITKLVHDPCECGRRAFPRIPGVLGRVDDAFSYKGTKIYPSAIAERIMKFSEVREFQIVFDKTTMPYRLIVRMEVPPEKRSPQLKEAILGEIDKAVFVRPELEFVDVGSLPRWEGKAKRVVTMEPK
ncbi:MAG: phenylacetate--CoA ligase [Candidatus Nezhaarchaeota archaeon]|nr:phenylacetate--CoA ligase [Candidatus Nezhaarchaeota archaeon]